MVYKAVAARGVLTGASALAVRGAWSINDSTIHVRATYRNRVLRSEGITPHAFPQRRNSPLRQSVDDLGDAFRMLTLSHSATDVAIIGDSIAHRNLLTLAEMQQIAQKLPPQARNKVASINGWAESGSETVVRLWLESAGIQFAQQVEIRGMRGRVDFLIGDRLVLEVDSREHHTGNERYQSDRSRDQLLVSLGYRVIRVTYADVFYHWDQVSQRILEIIRRDEHRGAPSGLR